MLLDVAEKPKRKVGRPSKGIETKSVSGRVPLELSAALEAIATLNRRSVSTEIVVAAEQIILKNEQLLREAGKWTPGLDVLKRQNRPKS